MPEESGTMTLPTVTASLQPADSPAQADPNGKATSPPNNSPGHVPSRLPQARRLGNSPKLLIAVAVLLVIAAGAAAAYWFILRPGQAREDLLTHVVHKEKLRVTVVERGTLESAVNRDVVCRVKAKTQGNTVASTIKWVIDDGTLVKQGQLLAELDSSGFQDQLKQQKITVDQAEAAKI